MSLYDEAAVALIAEGAAGKDGVLYNIKPEEKLKAEELVTNGGFIDGSGWEDSSPASGVITFSDGKAVFADLNNYHYLRTSTAVFEKDKTYKVSFTITDFTMVGTSNPQLLVQESDNQSPTITSIKASGQYSFIYKAKGMQSATPALVGTPSKLVFKNSGADASNKVSFKLDNVSVKEVEQAPLDFTFTRGSNLTATRVAPNGYIEKGRENLLKYSNGFDNALWEGYASGDTLIDTVTSGQSGYDGSSNAFLLNKDSSDLFKRREQIISETTGVATFSVYAKAGTASSISLRGGSDDSENVQNGNDDRADFNLANGTSSIINNAVTSSMEAITGSAGDTDRWYRCSVVFKDPTQLVQIYVNFNSASTGTVFVQNAQLENGLVATDYIESHSTTGKAGILEDSPRFDYTDVTCPHLLMEPDRRNLLPYSEYVGAWTGSQTTASFAISPDLSPEGQKNAYRVTRSGSGVQVGAFATIPDEVKRYTGSIWVKRVSGSTTCKLLVTENVAVTKNITDDWTRIEETVASTSGNTTGRLYIQPAADGDVIDIYGAQFECAVSSVADTTLDRADYATSYIPTHGSEGTRLNDEAEPADFSDYIDGEDFTLFVHLAKNDELIRDRSSTGIRFSTRDHNSSAVRIYRTGFSSIRNHVYWEDLDADTSPSAHEIDEAGPVKVAIRRIYSTGEWTVFYAGAQQNQAFNANYDKFTQLTVDANGDAKFINSILIFDRALTDDECIDLTT